MDWASMPWPDLKEELEQRPIVLLPIGATEAHGPHLPVGTDVIISHEIARRAAWKLDDEGNFVLILPSIDYSVTECAKAFSGTISIRPETSRALIVDIARSMKEQGAQGLVLVNSHLDPGHLAALEAAVEEVRASVGLPCCAPSPILRRWGKQLGDEFRKGDCHAGAYETSLLLAVHPELVREEVRKGLPPRWLGLVEKLKSGVTDFRSMGSEEAYFGDPACASVEQGMRLYEVLSEMVCCETALALPLVRWPDIRQDAAGS